MEEQVILFYGFSKKLIHELEKEEIVKLKKDIFKFVQRKYPGLIKEIREKKTLTEEIEKQIRQVYTEFIGLLKEKEEEDLGEEKEKVGEKVLAGKK